jgi:hypothetical protein
MLSGRSLASLATLTLLADGGRHLRWGVCQEHGCLMPQMPWAHLWLPDLNQACWIGQVALACGPFLWFLLWLLLWLWL